MTDDLTRQLSDLVEDAVPGEAPPFGGVVDRRRHRRRTRLAVGATVVAVAAVAIGVPTILAGRPDAGPPPAPATQSPTDPSTAARPDPIYDWADSPSPIVIRLPGRDVELAPWTSCWSGPPDDKGISAGMCADGMPGKTSELPDIGVVEAVDLWFGRPGWSFDATFIPLGNDCPRQTTVPGSANGGQWFHVDPADAAGRYRVDLFGRGPEGDVVTSFVWTTTADGPLDPPRATIALVTDGDGDDLMSYGLEVAVQDLAEQPRTASIEVTATAASGRSMQLTAPRANRQADCFARGSLFFQDNEPSTVADLGPAPFTYEVVLTLDGEEYVGTAVWPRDETQHEAPYTVLTFDPPLPGAELD